MIMSGLRHMRRTLVSKGEKRGCRVSKGVGAGQAGGPPALWPVGPATDL
jgi:hypothetical protein